MFDWNLFLDEAALATLLPGEYARFARPLRDGLIVFLDGLPASHQAEILSQQAVLPSTADIAERLGALARCCPVLHKLGQVLARDPRLAPELRRHLRALESLEPTVPDTAIREMVARELGPLEQVGIRLRFPALAEASVAVVVPFVEPQPERGCQLRGGVLKVLKPGIEERLQLELELLSRVGGHFDDECQALGIPALDYASTFQQIRDKLRHEVDLAAEQRNLARAAESYADEPAVQIPAVLGYCTPRMTAMERVTGGKVTDQRRSARGDGRPLARQVVQSLIGHPLFSLAGEAMFHGDPHAGNLFWTDDNRLAILDWSLVGSLSESDRETVVQILLAAAMLDARRMIELLADLADGGQLDRSAAATVVAASLKEIRHGAMPGVSWLVAMLDELVVKARLRAATDLLLFRKSLHTLEGVVAETGGGELSIDDILLADFCRHFARELPCRWRASPASRQFATRLSNIDLTRVALESPAAVARFWAGKSLDLLDACNQAGKLRV